MVKIFLYFFLTHTIHGRTKKINPKFEHQTTDYEYVRQRKHRPKII
jgi:hypothetical protein